MLDCSCSRINQRKCASLGQSINVSTGFIYSSFFFFSFVSLLPHAKGAGWNACTNTASTLCHSPVFTVCCFLLRAACGRAEGAWKRSRTRAKIPTGWEKGRKMKSDRVWRWQDEGDKQELSTEQCQAKVNVANAGGPNIHLGILRRMVMKEFFFFALNSSLMLL